MNIDRFITLKCKLCEKSLEETHNEELSLIEDPSDYSRNDLVIIHMLKNHYKKIKKESGKGMIQKMLSSLPYPSIMEKYGLYVEV